MVTVRWRDVRLLSCVCIAVPVPPAGFTVTPTPSERDSMRDVSCARVSEYALAVMRARDRERERERERKEENPAGRLPGARKKESAVARAPTARGYIFGVNISPPCCSPTQRHRI